LVRWRSKPAASQLGGDPLDGQHGVHRPGGHRRARHAVEPRLRRILDEGDPSRGLHRAQAQRPVGGGAGEDDRDGAPLVKCRQRAEEVVDRGVLTLVGGALADLQLAGCRGEWFRSTFSVFSARVAPTRVAVYPPSVIREFRNGLGRA
jgi:hypothetical protein